MANWTAPINTTDANDVLANLHSLINNLAKSNFSGDTNIPDDTIRHNLSTNKWEQYDLGTTSWTAVPFHNLIAYLAESETVSGAWTFSNVVTFGSEISLSASSAILRSNTADTGDNKSVSICGGGGGSLSRGAIISCYGNEHANVGGVNIYSGDATGSNIKIHQNSTMKFKVSSLGTDIHLGQSASSLARVGGVIYTRKNNGWNTAGSGIVTADSYNMPGNSLADGDRLRVTLCGYFNATTNAGKTITLKFSGVQVAQYVQGTTGVLLPFKIIAELIRDGSNCVGETQIGVSSTQSSQRFSQAITWTGTIVISVEVSGVALYDVDCEFASVEYLPKN